MAAFEQVFELFDSLRGNGSPRGGLQAGDVVVVVLIAKADVQEEAVLHVRISRSGVDRGNFSSP